jgi:hypothetical protein
MKILEGLAIGVALAIILNPITAVTLAAVAIAVALAYVLLMPERPAGPSAVRALSPYSPP